MAVNRVDYGGNTLIDLTGDTLESAEQLLKGIIAHAKDGSVITGLMEAGGGGGGNNVAYGTIIPEDMMAATLVIEHGLGIAPKFVFICAANSNNGVYNASKPKGQSFIYAFSPEMNNGRQWYYSRHLYSSSSNTDYKQGYISESISSGFSYYIAINDTSIIWANRNPSYGFGDVQTPFFWLAMKEVT